MTEIKRYFKLLKFSKKKTIINDKMTDIGSNLSKVWFGKFEITLLFKIMRCEPKDN